MSISYDKLWHILLDRKMKKVDLQRKADISEFMIKKLTRNQSVPTEVLGKICRALNCRIDDFVDFTKDEDELNG